MAGRLTKVGKAFYLFTMPGHLFQDSSVLTNSAWSYLRRADFLMIRHQHQSITTQKQEALHLCSQSRIASSSTDSIITYHACQLVSILRYPVFQHTVAAPTYPTTKWRKWFASFWRWKLRKCGISTVLVSSTLGKKTPATNERDAHPISPNCVLRDTASDAYARHPRLLYHQRIPSVLSGSPVTDVSPIFTHTLWAEYP